MTIIGVGELLITQGYLKRYLRWATTYAVEGVPDGLTPEGEFGVVSGNGTLRVVVPLVDDRGGWAATGLGPLCRPDAWAHPTDGTVN